MTFKLKDNFVYTTHPYLVSLFIDCPSTPLLDKMTLHCPDAKSKNEFIDAVHRGDIVWHAFPFNAEPELLDPSLFNYAFTMAQDLVKFLIINIQVNPLIVVTPKIFSVNVS